MPVAEGHYLCGCNIEQKRGYFHELDGNGNPVMSRKDKAGFDVCPEHGHRRYGWRSPTKQHPAGHRVPVAQPVTHVRKRGGALKESTVTDMRAQILIGGKTAEEVGRDILEKRARANGDPGHDVASAADQPDSVSP